LDVLAKLVVAAVVVAPNGRLFERTVHPLDLTVRPRMIWLCQPMLNPVRSAEQIEYMGWLCTSCGEAAPPWVAFVHSRAYHCSPDEVIEMARRAGITGAPRRVV
jgi:hypothetical protein